MADSKTPDESAPVLYRARLRRADGTTATDAFAVVQAGKVDGGQAGISHIESPAQIYRFKVRTADGKEVTSAIVIGPPEPKPPQDKPPKEKPPKEEPPKEKPPELVLSPVVMMQQVFIPVEAPDIEIHVGLDNDPLGNPFRSRPYQIVSGGKTVTGTTDAQGNLNAKVRPASRARLNVEGEHGASSFMLQLDQIRQQ